MVTLQSTPQLSRASETLITTSVQSQSGLTRADVTIVSSTQSAVRAATMLEWTGYHQVMAANVYGSRLLSATIDLNMAIRL